MGRRRIEAGENLDDVEARMQVVVLRHSVKGDDGELTDEGRRLAGEYWNDVFGGEIPSGDGRVFHSEIDRSRETAEIISLGLSSPTLIEDSRLSENPYTDEAITEYGIGDGIWLLEDQPSSELPPTLMLASRMASVIMEVAGGLVNVPEGEEELVFCVSHVPPIMLFLKYALPDRWENEDVLRSLGGFTKVLHGFQVFFERKRDGVQVRLLVDVVIDGNFFSFEEELSLDKLSELALLGGKMQACGQ